MRRCIIPSIERIVNFTTVDVLFIETEQLIFLFHLVYFKFARSQWCTHMCVIYSGALMNTDLLNFLVLLDTITLANQAHPSDQIFVVCYLLRLRF